MGVGRLPVLPRRLVECAYRRILPKHLGKGSFGPFGRTRRRLQGALNQEQQNLLIVVRAPTARLQTGDLPIHLNGKFLIKSGLV